MKKILVCVLVASVTFTQAHAQLPEDVLKYTWGTNYGSARANAVGGAMGSLGGDISALYVNPAGLGMYRTREIVLSPGLNGFKNDGAFRGTKSTEKQSSFNLGTTGFVFGGKGNRSNSNSNVAFGIGLNKIANFNNTVFYTGQNDFSSMAEQYALEASNSRLTFDQMLNSSSISLGTKMAIWNYYIDSASIPGRGTELVSMALQQNMIKGSPYLVQQSQSTVTTGGINELAFGLAANKNDKIYVGATIGFPMVRYTKDNVFVEKDISGNTNNNFNFSQLNETFTTTGSGINAKLGLIFKPSTSLRIGLAVHTPTWYSMEDTYDAEMLTDLEKYRSIRYQGVQRVTPKDITGTSDHSYGYELSTPWKLMGSASYVLHEVEDVRLQKGFITGDIEYVTHKTNQFFSSENSADKTYYNSVNNTMKSYYKNALNLRLGGELKFTTIMARAGIAYYGSPYADTELKANRLVLSGGLGYREHGMFVDLTYAYGIQKDVNFPYRLSDKANTFANINSKGSNVMLTLGFKI